MAFNKRVKIKTILDQNPIGQEITLMGWVRTKRSNKNVSFIALNDGSIITNYQVVADPNLISEEILKKMQHRGLCEDYGNYSGISGRRTSLRTQCKVNRNTRRSRS
ncbi:hypothetical protein [Algoriphagus boritolerans]|uniref:hypothetical protein n=1 Tax=Algoriphagus boritolerans TaxID=308111 RepID=UPI000A4A96BB